MPRIIPIKDLKNTGHISQMIQESPEPIFVTKNGYGEMVLMSIETYERNMGLLDLLGKLEEAEQDFTRGAVTDGASSLARIRAKYAL